MDTVNLTPEVLAGIIGVILSLSFSYIPGLNVKFAALEPTHKRLIFLGLALATVAAVFGLSCANVIIGFSCDKLGIISALKIFGATAIASQVASGITPQMASVNVAKANSSVKALAEATADVKADAKEEAKKY